MKKLKDLPLPIIIMGLLFLFGVLIFTGFLLGEYGSSSDLRVCHDINKVLLQELKKQKPLDNLDYSYLNFTNHVTKII